MGNYVVKISVDEDYYVVWNETSEGPEFGGPRDETEQYLRMYSDGRRGKPVEDAVADRLRRVDQHGTSAMWPEEGGLFYGWDDNTFIYQQRGIVDRKNLRALVEALGRDDEEAAWDLLRPFDDATEVRRGW